jgi:hypothetical protein
MRPVAAAAFVVALVAQVGVAHGQALATACPTLPDDKLQFVDVFDGAPEEQAYLVPDSGTQASGTWSLGYVYDAGRFVTVRCKYAHGRVIDLKIASRVARCSYTNDAAAGPKMTCR